MVKERPKRKVRRVGSDNEAQKMEKAAERAVEKALKSSGVKAKTQVVGFFDFIRERGVMGIAIGIIIGTTVTALVRSMVDDVINPIVSLFLVEDSLRGATFHLGSATIGWGNFVSALLDFIIIALVIYVLFRIFRLEKLDKKPVKKD